MHTQLVKSELTLEELAYLESEMLKKSKSKEAAWGLWAGLSFFGGHRFFTEDYKYASAMLTTTFIPFIVLIYMIFNSYYNEPLFYISLFLLIGSVIWSWIDAFFLNKRVIQLNDGIEQNILDQIQLNRTRSIRQKL
ncbi:TM2 domain-containing protein [Fictibacillus nanhaiensis]|uniref:TM2 domain-containing protein n=1 Tax=Fictibacillus nanhaiensis TaxID=742169 RepID=A0ABS2ZLA4_9BACL|nr:TM2 domain-containing protein [Fictibacillus nanhaiensis]